MTQAAVRFFQLVRRVLGIGGNGPQFVEVPEEPLTQREVLLHRAAVILRRGAIANAIIAILLALAGIIAALSATPDLFHSVHDLFLGRYIGPADVALATVVLLLLVDLSLMLVVMVGALAQEFWSVPAVWVLALLNVGALLLAGFLPALVTIAFAVWAGGIMTRDLPAFRVNPVMLKELRGRMRGARAFVVISVYLALMSGFTVLIYLIYPAATGTGGTTTTGQLGRVLFGSVVGIEMLLIIFIAPAFTSGAITGERERKTYDLLRMTLLPGASFVVGKLESALSYIVLLLLAAIPIQSIAFLFGGVSEVEVLLAFVILLVTALTLGSVGLFFSSVTARTLTASVRAYIIALVVTFAVPLVLSVFLGFYNSALTGFAGGVSNSPVMETLFIYLGLIVASVNPISAGLFSQIQMIEHQDVAFTVVTLASDGSKIPLIAPWVVFTVLYLTVSAVLLVLAVRRMRRMQID